ncbi:hypothetical protein ABKN59_007631 [Abortiporus biennis]
MKKMTLLSPRVFYESLTYVLLVSPSFLVRNIGDTRMSYGRMNHTRGLRRTPISVFLDIQKHSCCFSRLDRWRPYVTRALSAKFLMTVTLGSKRNSQHTEHTEGIPGEATSSSTSQAASIIRRQFCERPSGKGTVSEAKTMGAYKVQQNWATPRAFFFLLQQSLPTLAMNFNTADPMPEVVYFSNELLAALEKYKVIYLDDETGQPLIGDYSSVWDDDVQFQTWTYDPMLPQNEASGEDEDAHESGYDSNEGSSDSSGSDSDAPSDEPAQCSSVFSGGRRLTRRQPTRRKGDVTPRPLATNTEAQDTSIKTQYFGARSNKTVLCRWEGCEERISSDEKEVRLHLNEHFTSEQRKGLPKLNCRWNHCPREYPKRPTVRHGRQAGSSKSAQKQTPKCQTGSLMRHVLNTHLKDTRMCEYCGKTFNGVQSLSNHQGYCRKRKERDTQVEDGNDSEDD